MSDPIDKVAGTPASMNIEIKTPTIYLGTLMGLLTLRRCIIDGIVEKYGSTIVSGNIPTSEAYDIENEIHSVTGGQGSFELSLK